MDRFIEIEIDQKTLVGEVARSIEDVTKVLIREIAENFPEETRGLMIVGGVSGAGEVPHQQTKKLARSLNANPVESNSVEIEMEDYGLNLDEDRDRPFIDLGAYRALGKSLAHL